jgi:hypothetical protein
MWQALPQLPGDPELIASSGIVVNLYSNVKSRVADRDPHLFWKLDADPL